MKKAMMFAAAAFAAAAVLNPLTAEAAGTNQVKVVYKGNAQDCSEQISNWKDQAFNWNTQSTDLENLSECFKWGTILWNNGSQQLPGDTPEVEAPEVTPDTPEVEVPEETPNTPEVEVPGETPNTPEVEVPGETPNIPEVEVPEETPDTPQQPEEAPEQSTSEDGTQTRTFAEQVVDLVNIERQKEGLAPLTIDEKIVDGAAVRAKEIQQNFSHTRPNGTSFSTALKEAGATYRSAGENIAWGQKTPEEVVNAWMNSAGHRANIMSKNYSRIGVAHTKNASGTSYWAQLFAN